MLLSNLIAFASEIKDWHPELRFMFKGLKEMVFIGDVMQAVMLCSSIAKIPGNSTN